jgi:Reverse transcriptase (RNA-dependent DNA polymerase)
MWQVKMLCTRFDFWAEQNLALSPTQFGFRKGKGTRDCLAILTTSINTSFEKKEQTVAAFLDISGAYDNVLIDLLCNKMLEKNWPAQIVRLMWNLMWKKELQFYFGNKKYISRTRYKRSSPRISLESISLQPTRIRH